MTTKKKKAAETAAVPLVSDEVLDELLTRADAQGTELLGPDGLLNHLTKAVMERALDEELTDHLGYDKHDPVGRGSGNSRNGTSSKVLLTEAGAIGLDIPRDRNGDFEPQIVPKGTTRLKGFNDRIISLYARGMTVRDVQAHLEEIYDVDVSPDLISKVTDAVWDELVEWRNRPLDAMYPIVYIDALMVKIRDGIVTNRPAYLAVGIDLDGRKHVLGIWIGDSRGEGSKFWLSVLSQLKNRGVGDVLIVVCDGLQGLPDAIEAVWPYAKVQTCVVHLLRGSFRYASYTDRKKIAAGLRPIYTAVSEDAAAEALDEFDTEWGKRYPAIVGLWRDAWEVFVPFLDFPPEVRRVVYTTNMIESINYQLRKVTKTRGHFPNEKAALKLLYLAVRNITTERGGPAGTGTRDGKRASTHSPSTSQTESTSSNNDERHSLTQKN
jgi:transposase-like protein